MKDEKTIHFRGYYTQLFYWEHVGRDEKILSCLFLLLDSFLRSTIYSQDVLVLDFLGPDRLIRMIRLCGKISLAFHKFPEDDFSELIRTLHTLVQLIQLVVELFFPQLLW